MSISVFLTGATGYIAKHTIKFLLDSNYKVIGSVRSVQKGEQLKKQFKHENFSYEVVKVLEQEGAFDEALKKHPEVTVVLHMASPVNVSSTNIEEEVIIPAQNGSKYLLESVYKYAPQVKKLVYTSSYAAHGQLFEFDPSFVSKEDSITSITRDEALSSGAQGYIGSKILAEQLVFDFMDQRKPNFKLIIVSPAYSFGPQAFDEDVKDTLNVSVEVINQLLKLKPNDKLPELSGPFVDARDVAKAHIVAFEKEDVPVKRIFMAEDRFSVHNVLDVIHSNFPQLKGKIPESDIAKHAEVVKNTCKIDNSKTKEFLGFKFKGMEESIVDTFNQIQRTRGF